MKAVFDHIEQVRELLAQIFESGFASGRNISAPLAEGARTAAELGMSGGDTLLRELGARLRAFAAGQGELSAASAAYCNAMAYYNMIADMLVAETLSTHGNQFS